MFAEIWQGSIGLLLRPGKTARSRCWLRGYSAAETNQPIWSKCTQIGSSFINPVLQIQPRASPIDSRLHLPKDSSQVYQQIAWTRTHTHTLSGSSGKSCSITNVLCENPSKEKHQLSVKWSKMCCFADAHPHRWVPRPFPVFVAFRDVCLLHVSHKKRRL